MYTSPLFRKSWKYAQKLGYDKIFILSDKYYLLAPEDEIDTYDKSLKNCKSRERKEWAKTVLEKLTLTKSNLKNDKFIILAGKVHYEHLIGKDGIQNYSIPWKGVGGIGCILKFLNEQIAQLCENHK